MDEALLSYYENEGFEDVRIQEDGVQYTEFLTMAKYFERVFPKEARILDPCAGTGVYAFHLATQGHQVVAGDLLALNIEILREKEVARVNRGEAPLAESYVGDVRDLSAFPDGCFDGVLCMGALYHLLSEADRLQAVGECLRVLKPGGIFVATYINRLGAMACNFSGDVGDFEEMMAFLDSGVDGVFYAQTPSEIDELMGQFPLKTLYHIGADGIGYLLYGVSETISYEGLLKWRTFHLATCEMREILGYSYHGAYFGEKALPLCQGLQGE